MQLTRFSCACLLLVYLSAPSIVNAAELIGFQPRDVFSLQWVSEPQLSPNGKQVVFARHRMDPMADQRTRKLWLINSDGSDLVPLSSDERLESAPVWSPDGSRIAYVKSTDRGSEVFLYWLKSGKSVRLTELERSPGPLSWSPDSTRLAFRMRAPADPPVVVTGLDAPEGSDWAPSPRITTRLYHERDGAGRLASGYHQLFVVQADGGVAIQLTQGEHRIDGAPQWSADGQALFFSGNLEPDWEKSVRRSAVYRLDVVGGHVKALTSTDGNYREPRVSPDGRRIAFVGFVDRVQTYQVNRLYVMDINGSDSRVLVEDLDRSVSMPRWNANGRALYFQYPDQGATRIGRSDLRGRWQSVADDLGGEAVARPYGGGSFSVAGNDLLAYSRASAYAPAELAIKKGRGASKVITGFNAAWSERRVLGRVEEVRYQSSVDKRALQGWVVKPPGYDPEQRYPLVVENHGGPIAYYGPYFSPEIQLYAAAGYLVFYPNPRGSTGYGEEFGNLLYHNYPGDDYHDVMDGVNHLIKQGLAHENNLYVTGGSAGGIMTAWMIGKNQRFRAAAVIKPVMNWVSKTLTADNYFGYANYRLPGHPWENIETYMKFSPVSLVGEIETPTLVMVGTEDLRTPLSEAKQLYHALKIREIDTVLVEMPGASHFIADRPSQLIAKIAHILAWFERYPPTSISP